MMPTFKFTDPSGKVYRVEGPEGATQEQAWGMLQSQIPPEDPFERAALRQRQAVMPPSERQQQGPLSSLPGTILGAANEAARQAFETSRRMAEGEPVSAAPTFWTAVGASPAAIGRLGRVAEGAVPRVVAKEAESSPPPAPPAPAPVAPGITTDEFRFLRATRLAQERAKAADIPELPPYEPPGYSSPPPPSQMLPAQTLKEFGAVRKGVEYAAAQRAKEAAQRAAAQPHLNSIAEVASRSPEVATALSNAVPEDVLTQALTSPGKAASIAAWTRVYERAARAKFTPQAKASLDLATRNLNNNLGTDLTLTDVLGGQ